jgi:(5-formylfuran-3-yl)methyl phosphate synthase
MTQLLVSVRSAAEARQALAGGAALIDVKEPARGALGRADDDVIRAVVAEVAGRCPVSAALGEWADGIGQYPDADLNYVKYGLAGCAPQWRSSFERWFDQRHPQLVLTAYADWKCAKAPSVDDVFALASAHAGSVMLVDTCCKAAGVTGKARPTLLDWLPVAWLEHLCEHCRAAGVKIALAGSLGAAEIRALANAQPDWFAVRGAVCTGADRDGMVQLDKVRALVDLLAKEKMQISA